MRHIAIGHQMSLVPLVTEALDGISCISSMKFLSSIQLVPAAIYSGDQPHCYSTQCPCDTAQNTLCDTTEQLTSLFSRKASGQHPPRAKQWQCYYPYLQTRRVKLRAVTDGSVTPSSRAQGMKELLHPALLAAVTAHPAKARMRGQE